MIYKKSVDGVAVDMTPDEIAELEAQRVPTWDQIREERDRLISASDWTVLPDAPLTVAEIDAWKAYRQALRDLPQTYATPAELVWPSAPGQPQSV